MIPARGATPVLPGYTILRMLGRGGAAVVYLALQESLDRQVAVKVLRRDVEDPKVWREFRREAHAIARLSSHPHVLTVHTAGRSAVGQPYLVTEFLDRGSLGDVIAADGPVAPADVAALGVAVADALMAAHDLGILHRDVKPGNVLLARDGRIKLGDFGIARLLVGQSAATTDQIAFTPEHVAPEVLRNEPDGPWSDVYGLASTLATAAVGAPPLQQRPGERIEAFLSRKVLAPPPALGDRVPTVLAEPINRALDPQPSRRPTVAELRSELAAAAKSLGGALPLPPPSRPPAPAGAAPVPITAPAPAVTRRSGPPPVAGPADGERRRRTWSPFPVLVSGLFALLVATALVLTLLVDRDDGQSASPTTSPVTAAPTTPGTTVPAPAPATTPVPATTTPVTVPATPPPTTSVAAAVPVPEPATTVTAAPVPDTEPAAPASAAPPSTEADTDEGDVTAGAAEAFLRAYYDAVRVGDYERSWSQLTSEFQRGKARSYEYYVDFWNDNDVEVGEIVMVDADRDRAIMDVDLRWNGSRGAVTERFLLRTDADGNLLIADQETAD